MHRLDQYYEEIFHEIHAAAFYTLKRDFPKDLAWLSVGLLNANGTLKWKSTVNCLFLGDECKTKKVICQWEEINLGEEPEQACSMQSELGILENHMADSEESLARISMRLFESPEHKGFAPYITRDDDELPAKYYFIRSLSYCSTLLGQTTTPGSSKCFLTGTTTCLVPLVQVLGSDIHWVGGVVVCAKTDSDIWQMLPRLRAAVTSLLEPRRRLHSIGRNAIKNKSLRLLSILMENTQPNNHWFEGTCDNLSCAIHPAQSRDRHNIGDCRLMSDEYFPYITETYGTQGEYFLFYKSLFYVREKKPQSKPTSTPRGSGKAKASILRGFIKRWWGIEVVTTPEDSERYVYWPMEPGIQVLISILDIYLETPTCLEAEVLKERDCPKITLAFRDISRLNKTAIIFSMQLPVDGHKLLDAIWSGNGSKTTKLIKKRLCCDIEFVDMPEVFSANEQMIRDAILWSSEAQRMRCYLTPEDPFALQLAWQVDTVNTKPSVGSGRA